MSDVLEGLVIRLASESAPFKKALISELRKIAIEFDTPEAMKAYLEKHPKANPKNHTVEKRKKADPQWMSGPKSIKFWKKDLEKKLTGLKPGSSDDKYHEFARHFGVAERVLEKAKNLPSSKLNGLSKEKRDDLDRSIKESEAIVSGLDSQIKKLPSAVKDRLAPFLKKRHKLTLKKS